MLSDEINFELNNIIDLKEELVRDLWTIGSLYTKLDFLSISSRASNLLAENDTVNIKSWSLSIFRNLPEILKNKLVASKFSP